MSSGACSYGERCQFSHNPDDDPRGAPGVRSTRQAAACGDRISLTCHAACTLRLLTALANSAWATAYYSHECKQVSAFVWRLYSFSCGQACLCAPLHPGSAAARRAEVKTDFQFRLQLRAALAAAAAAAGPPGPRPPPGPPPGPPPLGHPVSLAKGSPPQLRSGLNLPGMGGASVRYVLSVTMLMPDADASLALSGSDASLPSNTGTRCVSQVNAWRQQRHGALPHESNAVL